MWITVIISLSSGEWSRLSENIKQHQFGFHNVAKRFSLLTTFNSIPMTQTQVCRNIFWERGNISNNASIFIHLYLVLLGNRVQRVECLKLKMKHIPAVKTFFSWRWYLQGVKSVQYGSDWNSTISVFIWCLGAFDGVRGWNVTFEVAEGGGRSVKRQKMGWMHVRRGQWRRWTGGVRGTSKSGRRGRIGKKRKEKRRAMDERRNRKEKNTNRWTETQVHWGI